MKELLVVAFHFPPDNSSGMLRTAKFVSYLPGSGWWPTVLTVPERLYESRDTQLLDRLPQDLQVVRARCLDSKKAFSIRGKYPSWLAIPDRYWTWIPAAVRIGARVIETRKVDAIFSTSPVPSAHLIGLALKRRFGLPWLADFRDPWAEPHQLAGGSSFRLRLERRLEGKVISTADRVIATTETIRDNLRGRYPHQSPKKFSAIYNGHDEVDFDNLVEPVPRSTDRVVILHAGVLYPRFRDPAPLLVAMHAAFKNGRIPRDRLLLRFVGGGSYANSPDFRARIDSLGLQANVEIGDRVSHHEALSLVTSSDILLLLQYTPELKAQLPAKIFEYARAGRPILAITSPGETESFVRRYQLGPTAAPEDLPGLERALVDLVNQARDRRFEGRQVAGIEEYERHNLATKLASELERTVLGQDL